MQPELPTSPSGNEHLPATTEQFPDIGREVPGGERTPERSVERQEQRAETAARAAELARQAPQAAPPMPTPVQGPPAATMTTADDTPATAADEDLIEKEWVDKAKKIIASTQDDPAEREREVAKLQADYLKKRYGKQLGAEQ